MIVCSCNHISDKDIKEAIQNFEQHFPGSNITEGKVLRILEKKFDCLGCLPLIQQTVLCILESKKEVLL